MGDHQLDCLGSGHLVAPARGTLPQQCVLVNGFSQSDKLEIVTVTPRLEINCLGNIPTIP